MKLQQTEGLRLSFPSKMPCACIGLPALESCKTGTKLAEIEGSVCEDCYALKWTYRLENVKAPRQANMIYTLHALESDQGRADWVAHMAALIDATDMRSFRWHDSGDIMSSDHLLMIFRVCELTPSVRHWLPTREVKFVTDAIYDSPIPPNLNIRISANMVGKTITPSIPGLTASSVSSGQGFACKAPSQDGKCLSCRACWSRDVQNIDYKKH